MKTHCILSSIFLSDHLVIRFLLDSATRGPARREVELRHRQTTSTNSHPRPAWKPAYSSFFSLPINFPFLSPLGSNPQEDSSHARVAYGRFHLPPQHSLLPRRRLPVSTLVKPHLSLQPSSMDPPESADPANPFSPGADSTEEEGPHEILVHGLKAKFFLNQPVTDLLPDRYLEKAENSRESSISSSLSLSTCEWTK
jgi:hypothetical protein